MFCKKKDNIKIKKIDYVKVNGKKICVGDKVYYCGCGVMTVRDIIKDRGDNVLALEIQDVSKVGIYKKTHISSLGSEILNKFDIKIDKNQYFYCMRVIEENEYINGFYKIESSQALLNYSGDDIKKSELVSGNILQDFDGNNYIFIKETNDLVDICHGSCISLDLYDNYLRFKDYCPELDIVKLAKFQLNYAISCLFNQYPQRDYYNQLSPHLDVYWDLERKKMRELTVEQICRELGEEIKIVR